MKKRRIKQLWTILLLFVLLMAGNYNVKAEDNYDGIIYISTPSDMNKLMNGTENTTFQLTCDIDMSKYSNPDSTLGSCWTPVKEFKGNIDGQGFAIQNLKVINTAYAGLIAYSSSAVTIKNLHMSHVSIKGQTYAAGIIAFAYDDVTMKNCSVSGGITVQDSAGRAAGLIGGSNDTVTISECMNTAQVTGYYASGIVCIGNGTVADCVNTGIVNSRCGYEYAMSERHSNVYRCYNRGTNAEGKGLNIGGDYIDSSYTNLVNATGDQRFLSDDLMKIQDSFAGFNFETVWAIDSETDHGYPYLRSMDSVAFKSITHDLGDWQVKKSPTCTQNGLEVRCCRFCGAEAETRETAPAHGELKWYVTKDATSREAGCREQRCEECDEVLATEEIPMIYEPVESIKLSCTELTLYLNETEQLTAVTYPKTASYPDVTWSSSDASKVTVDAKGNVKALAPGSVTITASATDQSGITAQCHIVIPATITYNMNGGTNSSSNPISYTQGETISLEAATRAGYLFKGWYQDAACTQKIKVIQAATATNYVLYAKWEKVNAGNVKISKIKTKKGQMTIKIANKSKVKCQILITKKGTDYTISRNIGKSVTTKKIGKLSAGTYYVKMRAYKTDSTGSVIYGKYTKVKKVKVK